MPRLFQKRSGTWVEIKSIFQKQGGTWTEILNVFQKIGGTWTKVFAGLKVPGNTVAPTITGSSYLYGTLTNNSLGTWTNSPTSYTRQWRRGTPAAGGGEPTGYSNISGATSSTYTTTSDDNGKYIICQITATNTVGNNSAASNYIYVSKYAPESLLPYTLSGSTLVGSNLTAQEQVGSWKNTTTNIGDTYPDTFEYEWSYSDGTIIQSTSYNGVNSNIYLIVNADLNKVIRFRVTGTNTGGSATSGYTTSGTITSIYSFSFGNTLYVGSNGYITLDQAPSSAIAALPAGNGRTINIWNEDLVQYKLQEYSDSSNYYLYFRSYRYQSPLVRSATNALDYQIKFYTDQQYCDVYLVRKGASVPTYINDPGFYSNGLFGATGISGPFFWGAGSVLRVYFNGTVASTSAASWSAISDGIWKDISASDIDDSYTAVLTSANQSAPFPSNISAPTLSTDTGNFSAGSTITVNSGTWSNVNSYGYELLYGSSTPISDTSASTKTLVNTNQYVITNADATNPSYYFRGRVTGYSGLSQTGNTAIALSSTSSRSYINPTTTISVGTATSSGFTISGTAGPLSGFGTTYANITSIQIFNSSLNLVSTITSGLPTVNGTSGAWSYVWTGGSASTRYYAKATVAATDTSQTLFTTGFSSFIDTTAALAVPGAVQSLSSTTISGGARISWSAPSSDGGSAITRYEIKRDSFSYFNVGNVTSYDYTLSAGTYTIYVRAVNAVGNGTESSISVTVPSIPTITMNANTNISTSGATINWSSTNQSYAYVDSLYVGNVNSYTFSFLGSSTTYSGTVTVYSSTGNSASANYSFTTSSPAPVARNAII
jgi:hypothetical protein